MNALRDQINSALTTLFQRNPALCGFSVRQDLSFSEVACHPALYGEDERELINDISGVLGELLEEQPDAAELLRGRTLARRVH